MEVELCMYHKLIEQASKRFSDQVLSIVNACHDMEGYPRIICMGFASHEDPRGTTIAPSNQQRKVEQVT